MLSRTRMSSPVSTRLMTYAVTFVFLFEWDGVGQSASDA